MIGLINQIIKGDVPVLLWGAPGVGKTACVCEMAKEANAHVEVVIGSTIDPTDLGRPIVTKDDDVKLIPPAWAKRLKETLDNGKEAWLFLDELTSAPPSVQAALLRVVNERKVADLDLTGCKMIAAANPSEHATDSSDLSSATSNRWAHLNWEVDANEWIAGELSGWGKPDSDLAEIRGFVTGWITKQSSALLDPPAEFAEGVKGWPSPRSWSNLIKALGTPKMLKTPIGRSIATGLVGQGAASELIAWSLDVDLPSVEELLAGKKKLPARGDRANLAMSMVISHVINNPKQLPKAWGLCNAQREDLCILSAKKLMKACEKADIDPRLTSDMKKIIRKIRNNG